MEDNKDVQVTEEKVEKETTQKTYTKEDVDNSFNAGVRKANSDWQKDPLYKEFQEWRKNSQSDSEKLTSLETNNNELTKENAYLKAQIEVNDSDVKKEFRKFVTSEVMGLVNDTTDFETALGNYKKENPQYFGETVVKKVQSSPNLTGREQKSNTVNDIFNNMVRDV